jgi:hypothetical protein
MRHSPYFNELSRELDGFVTRTYFLVTSEVYNEGSRQLNGCSRELNGWSREHNWCVHKFKGWSLKVSIFISYICRSLSR